MSSNRPARMRWRELQLFTTELRDLLAAGMSLGNALNSLANRTTGTASDVIVTQLRDEIIRGSSLSEAMAQHPKTFSQLYVSMIRAGEASGAVDEVLDRISVHLTRIQELRGSIVAAMTYPMIVLFLGGATLVFAMAYIVPKFRRVFDALGGELPVPTKILIGMSNWLTDYWWVLVSVILMVCILVNRAVKTTRGRLWWHGMLLKMPLVRGVVASGMYANFARTLGTLLGNGVPVLQALSIVEKTVGNTVIERELRTARERVTDGTTISGPLASGKVFPRMMTDMLAIGEETGDMPKALSHIAERYESELNRNIKIFTTALEPILIVLTALAIGFVAIAILMAVLNMTSGMDA
jgi:type II secretory pathway component PulF